MPRGVEEGTSWDRVSREEEGRGANWKGGTLGKGIRMQLCVSRKSQREVCEIFWDERGLKRRGGRSFRRWECVANHNEG